MKNIKLKTGLLAILLLTSGSVFASGEHKETGEHEEAKEEGIEINAKQRAEANIKVQPITLKNVATTVHVPGEVMVHGYRSQVITPRIDSMVIKRYVVLGDNVKINQPLALLFSVDMANAQGDFIVASNEWKRVKKLGKKVVSAKRYVEAKVGYQQAKARLQAYGMAESEIANLLKETSNNKPGNYTLFSNQNGIIASDNFKSGEIIQTGRTLFDVVDESILWVEAQVNPENADFIKEGDIAWIKEGTKIRKAVVSQKNHVLDAITRTLTIRLELDNSDHSFAPGEFVDVEINSNSSEKVLAMPANSVLRSSDGDWQIFIEDEHNKFSSVEVEVVRTAGDTKVITGIKEGTKVVTSGAFFVQSEIAKSGFSIHNH